ncbi:MAG: RNA polymerase factor sigma-54 [Deltaproteobacteria bacterium]|nr:RNA polymerase factor sigma-54 [Deltaproteobacteria bacterium]
MAHEIRQDLRLSQQLVMSPQLQLAIKLLQLSRLELAEMVKEEMETNPTLEEDGVQDDAEPASDAQASVLNPQKEREVDWEAYLENCYERPVRGAGFSEDSEESSLEATLTRKPTLVEHLMWQLHLSPFTQEETQVGEFIIGNIDDDGYLRIGENNGNDEAVYLKSVTQEIAAATGACEDVVEITIKKVQQFDPVGVGSRTLKECLLTQAEFLGCKNRIVEEIINRHMGNLENKNYKAIATVLKIPIDNVIEAVKVIMGFCPRPGSAYGQSEANAVIPDIYIQKAGGDYVILLNESGLPKLKVSPYYRALIAKNGRGADATKTYVQERLRSARWLIQSIHQRQRTIYKVAQSIVKFQREFFDNGPCFVKPLILRDVALDVEMHESTISRVTSNKYAHTPHGIFELKYFFSPKINTTDSTDMSSKSVMEKLRGIYAMEDATKPLSDQKILEILKSSGIDIARRTITKYREAMGILSASKRKRLF